jgi:hypothetical protein
MEMVRDGEAASSTQRTITARDVDRRCNGTSWLPSWWRLCLLTVLEITWTYGYLGRAGPSSAHEMMPSLV